MAPIEKTLEIEQKTFYLYDYSNNLVLKSKKIYSPYNVKTLWRTPSEDYFNDPDFVEFRNWQYVADLKKLWPVRFNQQIEWLSFYNPVGWQLSKWEKHLNQMHLNGRFFKNDWIHVVHAEQIDVAPKAEVEIRTEVVEKQQIPSIVANNMNVLQLQELAWEWKVELAPNIMESWDAEKIKTAIIETLTLAWHIK